MLVKAAAWEERQAILKLATKPEPMLTTLERMSWLLIILATITLTAFLQPGMKGVVAGNAAELDRDECRNQANEKFLSKVEGSLNATAVFDKLDDEDKVIWTCTCMYGEGPRRYGRFYYPDTLKDCQSYFLNLTVQSPGAVRASTGCRQLDLLVRKCTSKEQRMNSAGEFAIVTVSSFCLTLLCLMLIVVVSLPRLKCTDLAYEAGRLWLFLLLIWLLFVECVQLAFIAFWIYAVVVYDPFAWPMLKELYWYSIFNTAGAPGSSWAIFGTACLTLPALIVVCVYFAWLYPGHKAVHLACCSCTCFGPTHDFVHSYNDRAIGSDSPFDMYVYSPPEDQLLTIKSA